MDANTLHTIRLSLLVAGVSTALVALCGGAIAYFLATRRFPGKGLVEVLLTLPLVMPPTVIGYYLIVLFGRSGLVGRAVYDLTGYSLMFTWHGAVLAAFVVSVPLMIRTAQAAIETVDPNYRDAAYTLGYSEAATAWKVVLPLASKGLLAGIILSFARAIGEFGATLMVCGNIPGRTATMPLTIYGLVASGEWDKANLLVLVLTLLSAVFLYLANRYGKRGLYGLGG